jgi:hypothetical protein
MTKLSWLGLSALLGAAACASNPSPGAGANSGGSAGAAAPNAGAPSAGAASAGAGSSGGGAPGASGSSSASAGAPPAAAGTLNTPQPSSNGGSDNGDLFNPDNSVSLNIPDASTAAAGGASGAGGTAGMGGGSATGDGNMATAHFMGPINGTAVFTQTGKDVAMVVNLTTCSAGDHRLFIGSGDSCDNASTEGNIWDGKRGDGLNGPILVTCANNKGTLSYMRSGSDPATNWTVADHNFATDVSNRVVLLSDVANIATNRTCSNFF